MGRGVHTGWTPGQVSALSNLVNERGPSIDGPLFVARDYLLPVGGNHAIQCCMVVGRQAGLPGSRRCEGGHGVNQVSHLRIAQGQAIAGKNLLNMIARAEIPVADADLVASTNHADFEVAAYRAEPQLVVIDAREDQAVVVANSRIILGDLVLAIATGKQVAIVAETALQAVIAQAATEDVGGYVAFQAIAQFIATGVDVGCAGQG